MIICGIDYSLTSPALCVHDGIEWNIKNCKFYYLVQKPKNCITTDQFFGSVYKPYASDVERFQNLSTWSLKIIQSNNVTNAYLEGYAFGAVGRTFQIAENCGILKNELWKNKIHLDIFPPSMIKKHATGKGNSPKDVLYEAFFAETGVDIRKELGITNFNQWNPLSDIVDAYYIAKLGHMKEMMKDENHA